MRLPISLLLLGCVIGAQQGYDLSSRGFKAAQQAKAVSFAEPLVPSTQALRFLSLGDNQLAADLLWIDTIQYFGAGNPYGKYAALGPMLDRITALDPQFEYPYEFGLVVLPYMDQSRTAVTLGLRAQDALPNNGLLTYYLATVYHLDLKDYKNAATYYQKASKEPGSPPAAVTLAGVSLSHLSDSLEDRVVALAYWQTVYDNAKSDDERTRAKAWYDNTNNAYALEKAAASFKDNRGRYPQNFQELIDAKLIPSVPDSPIGLSYVLDPATGRVSFK